jgi:DNA-binding LacI/PurR family transcriptional regulator
MASNKSGARKRVTINEIAQMAQTSKTTVSFYLNGKTDRMSEDTQQRIRDAIAATGYEPSPLARGMNAKKSFLLGVIIGDITNTFSNQIVKGIDAVASANGYRMLVCSSNFDKQNELAYIERLLALGVDGFIVQPTAQFKEITKSIADAGKQMVFIDSKLYDFTSNWVKTDNYEASYQAIEQCVAKGYERFLVITAAPGLISSRIERFSGFVDALERHDMTFSQFLLENDRVDADALRAWLGEHIDGKTPTMIFAPNCWALPDIYMACRDFYPLMPDRVGLLGFDNTEWVSVASPSVSVVVQPAAEEGQTAARILLDQIAEKGEIDPHQVLDCRVQWGTSTL